MDMAITTCYLRAVQRREEIDMFFALLRTPLYNCFREGVNAMNIRSLVGALAVTTQAGDLTQNQLILLTATGTIFGTPVFSDDPVTPETEAPRAFLRACFGKSESTQPKKHVLCGSEPFFLLQNATVVIGNELTKLPFLFVRYDSVLACTVGSIDYK